MELGAEEHRLRESRTGARWRRWGPYLSERQWGTVREDYSDNGDAWDVLQPRPGTLAGLPLGRGRPRRHLSDDAAAAVLRPGAVERARPDPEGAALRADERRGQPRRGREGVLLLPRQPAHPLATSGGSTSTRRRPTPTTTWSRTNRSRSRGTELEYELIDTGRLRRRPLLRRRGRVRQGRPERHPLPHHRAQPWPGPTRRSTCCPRCGSATPGRGRRSTEQPPDRRASTVPAIIRSCGPTTTSSVATTCTPSRAPTLLFCENETNHARLGAATPTRRRS